MELNISHLSLKIHGSQILSDVSCRVESGETVGLIGPNGSGKTTLFNAISGFIPLESGQVMLGDLDITHLKPHVRAQHGLGRIFQNPGIFLDLSLEENILIALDWNTSLLGSILPMGSKQKENRRIAAELLNRIGLSERSKVKASSLSGGQKRLLEIIRAVAFNASLFLLDEPTAGVSPKMKQDVSNLIKELSGQGKTILIIEHDMNFIEEFCSRVIVLDQGTIVLDGTPAEIRSSERLREIYFGK